MDERVERPGAPGVFPEAIQDADFGEEEQFFQYVDGAMEGEEREEFLGRLEADEGLAERFRAYEEATRIIGGLSEARDEVNLLPNLERRMAARRRSMQRPIWRVPLEGIGVALVMLLAVVTFVDQMEPKEVVVPVVMPSPLEMLVQAPPAPELLGAFGLSITEATAGLERGRVWTGMVERGRVPELISGLGVSVRDFPGNPCDPCVVFIKEFELGTLPEVVPDAPRH